MPDPRTLRPGDRIRIIAIPAADAAQAATAERRRDPLARWTLRILQRLADREDVVRINSVDAYGHPWFSYHFRNKTGTWEYHELAVMDHDSWQPLKPS